MAWYNSNACDCFIGDCNCGSYTPQIKYAIFYDTVENKIYEMKGHFKFKSGKIVKLWYPNDNAMFLSNEVFE